ncbi:MAG TPA: TauD/TfdA family dioxygenase, partial [Burkholderiaceae bacterium]|nr:TauD/TfdA family dioxygenase [Burkholderiaceae bacterium]
MIYWGIGLHLGEACAQNAQGDLLGHVRDLRADYKTDMRARGYQTRSMLPFHNDSQDIVGLLCLRRAKEGGLSRIVSSTAIHNAVLERRPDLYGALTEPFCIDRRGEEPQGRAPYYKGAPFEALDGRLFVRYNRTFYESAQRHPGVAPLSESQKAALDLMDELCNDPEFYLEMDLRPGDMQFINNYTVLHSRTEYDDWFEPERKRHLLRLWLRTNEYARIPDSYLERYGDMREWQKTPRTPVFDVSEIQAALAH